MAASVVAQDVAERAIKEVDQSRITEAGLFTLACERTFGDQSIVSDYACTWDPATGPEPLPVR